MAHLLLPDEDLQRLDALGGLGRGRREGVEVDHLLAGQRYASQKVADEALV
jgi:hypothetical protein